MAGEFATFGIQKLWDLLSQECERFQGVEDQVNGLKRDLNLLNSFLKDADAKKHTTAVVRNCVDEIQEIVYDAEDIIETYLLKEQLGKTSGVGKRIRRLACLVPDRRKYALDIGGIRTRISDVIRDMQNFGVQQAVADGGYMPPQGNRQREMRRTFPKDYESDFVALEANVKTLVGYLVEKDDIRIVSVIGMGGLGKTTLARQVFNHEVVKHHFQRLAWVCVSQDFTRISVWQEILQNLTSKERKDEIQNMKEDELQDELFQLLETSKSLIVFDDIWKEEDWDLIKPIFPPKKGWKVLLTSRNESVVVHGNLVYINFKPDCLTSQDSWTLFQRIAMPHKDAPEFNVNEEMEESAKEMIKHCGGLPLAVKVLGGLLAENYTMHDWKRLSENIGSHVVIGRTSGSSIDHVLSLSFEELPSYLKHCFLYLAHFPEDHKIEVECLSYLWAAEGISKYSHNNGESIRDVADGCIEELLRRNMIIAERDVMTLRFETCRLHDMMREVCLIKAKGENFLQIVGSNSSSSSTAASESGTSRRLVLHNPTTTSHVEGDLKNPKLRSLVIVRSARNEWKVSGLNLSRLQMMRVLDLSFAKFEGGKLPSSIGKLIHLRYLSLYFTKVSHLPYSLRNLKLLIYLNLYTGESIFVPNVLMEMQELKYLELPLNMHKKTKLELRNLEKLETLKNFSTKNGSIEDLRGMARLRILSIWLNDETSLETISASISGLKHLEFLSIRDRSDISSDRRIEEGIVLDFIHLKRLELGIKLLRQKCFPSHLTAIKLWKCCLEEDPMPILEKLLQLKEVSLLYDSFSGRRMVCSGGGFPQLHTLEFYRLEEWEEWIVEEGSMPLLHTLNISCTSKLKEFPDGLRFIYSLKHLILEKKWKERLSEGGVDFYKVQHIPSIDFCWGYAESD